MPDECGEHRASRIAAIVLALLVSPALAGVALADGTDPLTCSIKVDWDAGSSEPAAEHGYIVSFSRNLSQNESEALSLSWNWTNSSGFSILSDLTGLNDSNGSAISRHAFASMPSFGDSIVLSVGENGTAALCERSVRATTWNEPIADHEITLDTSWSLQQENASANSRYNLLFQGRGWQQRTGDLLESNELGDGLLTIVTNDGQTEMDIQLLLDRVWLNQSSKSGVLERQVFEMFGNGSMDFVTIDEVGMATNLTLNVTNSWIVRSNDYGNTSESLRIEASGSLGANGSNDDESLRMDGEVSLFLLETEHANGTRTLHSFEFQAMADMQMSTDDFRMDIDLEELRMKERWEGEERTEQFSIMKGDGAFDFLVTEGNGSMTVNGTIDEFWFESLDGSTVQTRIYMDGDIEGDIEGEIGYILDVIDEGTEQNSTGHPHEIIVVREENWLNITSITAFGQEFTELEAEHNLTYHYNVPIEHWENRTVMERYVEDDGRVVDERPNASPIERPLEAPDEEAVIGDANVSRETGVAPEALRPGDVLVLDGGEMMTLRVTATSSDVVTRDGHDIAVTRWNGTYGGGGTASGAVASEGILAGLVVEVTRGVELDIDGENITFVEQQGLSRVLSPSIISASENTAPQMLSARWAEGFLTTEGGVAHLEVTVGDPDWNMATVAADLSVIGLGTVQLNDIGLGGDRVIHDDIWTVKVEHDGLEWGENTSIHLSISDVWTTVEANTSLDVDNLAPRLLSFTPTPSSAIRGANVSVAANAIDAHGVASVSVDLRAAGGLLHELTESDGLWTGTIHIPDGLSPGPQSLTVRLVDTQGAVRETAKMTNDGELLPTTPITVLNDGPMVSDLRILRNGEQVDSILLPSSDEEPITHVLTVRVRDADGVQTVQARLGVAAPVGQSESWLLLRDDGTLGDEVSGDGNFSIQIVPRASMPTGTTSIEIRGLDTYLESTPGNERDFEITIGASGGGGGDPGEALAFLSGPVLVIALVAILLGGAGIALVVMLRNSEFGDGEGEVGGLSGPDGLGGA